MPFKKKLFPCALTSETVELPDTRPDMDHQYLSISFQKEVNLFEPHYLYVTLLVLKTEHLKDREKGCMATAFAFI